MDAGLRNPALTVSQLVEGWLAGLGSAATRSAYATDLRTYFTWCAAQGADPVATTPDHIAAFRHRQLEQGDRPATVARRMSALNGFVRFAQQSGVATAPLDGDQAAGGATVPASPTPGLDAPQRARLLAALPHQRSVTHLLVSMLLLDGVKLDEALRLDWSHITGRHPSLSAQIDRAGVRGTTSRTLTLDRRTAEAVQAHAQPSPSGPVFIATGGSQAGQRLSRFGADYLVKKAGRDAGLSIPVTANVLRRTHVSHAQQSGTPLDDIRRRVGHGDVRTTRRYLSATPLSVNPLSVNPDNQSPVWARTGDPTTGGQSHVDAAQVRSLP